MRVVASGQRDGGDDDLAAFIDAQTDRIVTLEKTLWKMLKTNRDWCSQAADNARADLEWAMAEGLNEHLPTIEEVQAAGPYFKAE